MKKLTVIIIVISLSLILVVGCGSGEQVELEIDSKPEGGRVLVDQADREVKVPEKIERVVALDTGLCGIILTLGHWDTIVGTTRYTVLDDLLMEVIPDLDQIPTPGTSTDVSIESLLELQPDVVIGGWEIDFIHQIETAGMAAMYVEPVTFQDQFAEVKLIGELYGEEERAAELIGWMEDKLQQIYERVKDEEPVRTLYLWGDPDIRNEMLYFASGVNVAGDIDQRWPNVALEQILTWDPEVIMVLQMARWLHPEQTSDLDPEQWLNELKETYYRPLLAAAW